MGKSKKSKAKKEKLKLAKIKSTKSRIDLKAGVIEIEGSEEFVRSYIEEFKVYLKPAGRPASSRTKTKRKSAVKKKTRPGPAVKKKTSRKKKAVARKKS